MAAFYQDFVTSIRTTEPDPNALIAQLKALDASAGVQHEPGTTAYRLKKATSWTAPQISAALNALETAPALTPQSVAQAEVDSMSLFQKALIFTTLDQINALRAALPVPLQAITTVQMIAAVRAKAGSL